MFVFLTYLFQNWFVKKLISFPQFDDGAPFIRYDNEGVPKLDGVVIDFPDSCREDTSYAVFSRVSE